MEIKSRERFLACKCPGAFRNFSALICYPLRLSILVYFAKPSEKKSLEFWSCLAALVLCKLTTCSDYIAGQIVETLAGVKQPSSIKSLELHK